MKNGILITALFCLSQLLPAQNLVTKNGHIRFFSHTPVEDIEANNHQVVSIFDPVSGKLQFMLLVKSFGFEKKLMEEHFNENYMESDKFPKASFEGSVINVQTINFKKNGNYPAQVKGKLTIHGVTKEIDVPGSIVINENQVSAKSVFKIKPEDYDIAIPELIRENIAKEIEISVDVIYTSN
jgi:polyisoprenoid-binding protein YceI